MSLESVRNLGQDLPKIVAELQGLTITGPVDGAGANTAILVPGIDPEDTILSIVNLTDLTAVDVSHVTITDLHAVGTLTVGVDVADGDAVVVNGKTYTFRELTESIAYNAAPNIVPFDADASGANDVTITARRLAQVLMSSDSGLTATSALGVVTINWRTAGTGGNSKTLAVTGAGGHVTRSAATLLGGSATASIKCSDSTASKRLLVVWFNKR